MSVCLGVKFAKEFNSLEEMEKFEKVLKEFLGDVCLFDTDFCEKDKERISYEN